MKRFVEIMLRILRPSMGFIILLTLVSFTGTIFVFATSREASAVGLISHVLSAYTLTVLVINIPYIISRVRGFIETNKSSNRIKSIILSNEYSTRYMTDKSFRTIITLYTALGINFFYAVFKMAAGVYYASFWYGADAIFYIALSGVQFAMLQHMRKNKGSLENEYRQYRFCGYLLVVLNAALIGVVYQIVHQNMGYEYPGLLIYMVAAYAFIYLVTAIVNVFTYRKLNSPVLSAVRAIILSKALVAIFALQTAMLTTFGSGDDMADFTRLMNSLTGGGVCLLIFCIAIYMIVNANKNLGKMRTV